MSLFIGLMSGTSADGMDAALVECLPDQPARLIHAIGLDYEPAFSSQLRELAITAQASVEELALLDRAIAKISVQAVNQLLAEAGKRPTDICAIGSHGHTLRHKALRQQKLEEGFSWQVGDPSWIAEHSGICCIADFRRRDIAAGGQGAPLVPAFHQECLSDSASPRMVLNIGGIANLTVLGEQLAGFDCGPGNALMDEWCQLQWQQPQDFNGERAATGAVIPALLEQWQQQGEIHTYLQQPPPKSTGRELFNLDHLAINAGNHHEGHYHPEDVLATLSQLTANTIANAVRRFGHADGEILVCGGGVHNPDLMQRIRAALPGHTIDSSAVAGIDPDWMEAMAFAWLAYRTLNQLPGNAPQVTGAQGFRILGGIYPA